ncbi:MAG: hypothetical protein HC852_23345 [Acaryochloridaceae cyanobacterium RU_4_10]|nr:hypothetical protein [Acaryochloridaceae cyanobacterium RU_4_10]
MNVLVSQNQRSLEVLEQKIYDHLLNCVRTELPEQILERFQLLFVQAGIYPEPEIRIALHESLRSNSGKQGFLPFFNRCCFIIINRWQMNLLHRDWIVQLVEIIGQCGGPSVIVGQPTPAGRLRFLIQEYVRSEYFQRLQQLADFLNPKNDTDERRPLSTLLHRYPFLYPHCLTNQQDETDYQKMIVGVQKSAQQQIEQDLSHYLTHSLLQRNQASAQLIIESNAASIDLKNPTLLKHKELCASLKHYVSKVDSRGTYQDMAKQFWTPTHQPQTYQHFKASLHDYVTSSIPPQFGKCRFNDQLKGYLDHLSPENDSSLLNDFLTVRTCNQVLNFMVIESRQRPNHSVFMDLLNNVGTTLTIGLLLKVVLLCNKVKPYLERRFSLLFQHYESHAKGAVAWLVKCLEKLNIAWVGNFSRQNLSFVHLF